jgi:hypothetical protein
MLRYCEAMQAEMPLWIASDYALRLAEQAKVRRSSQ